MAVIVREWRGVLGKIMARTREILLRYGGAVLAILLATGLRWFLNPILGDRFPLGTYFIAVVVVAWYGGLGPSLLALLIAFVTVPSLPDVRGTWPHWSVEAEINSWRFLVIGSVVALLGGAMRAARQRAILGESRAKQALDAERAQGDRLRVTLQSIAEGIIVTDSQGHVTSLNPVAERMTGWVSSEAFGQPLAKVFRTVDQVTHRTAELPVLRVIEGRTAQPMDQTELVDKGGRRIAIEHCTAPIQDDHGDITGVVIIFRDVTERRRAEESLKASEERFARFMQHLPGLAWIKDGDGHYVYANDAAEKAFRLDREDLYGRTDDEVFSAETAAQFKANDRRALSSRKGVQVIETLEHEDGILHHSVVSKFAIPSQEGMAPLVGGMAIDITGLKRAEEALRLSEEQFHTLADSIPQLAWMARPDGSISWFNQRWLEYTGEPLARMEGWGWQSVLDPVERERVIPGYLAAIASGEPWEDTFPLRRHDGTMRWHLSRALPVRDESKRVVRWFGTHTDITDRMEMEAALKEADRRKDEFLATLAHELRNPLASIRNALFLMGREQAATNGLSHEPERAMAERQVVHLARLVGDLLDIARISRGKIELRKELIEVATVIRRTVESARPALAEHRHALEVHLTTEPILIEADPTRLEQILGNLLNNASKYTEPGGRVELSTHRDGDECVITVKDTGIGIEASMLPRVFDMFVQVEDRSARAQGGLGIGLSLVKMLVEKHGGSVDVRSEGPGRGSEFLIRLPVAKREPGELAEASRAESRPDRPLPRRRVLVVDDNVDAATSLGKLLRRLYGQDVKVAHDGPSALELSEQFRPEVILLDLGMPGMDGYEVARRLRERPDFEGTRLIALTGWGQESARQRSQEAKFDLHLVKPVDPEEIRLLLAELGA